MKSFLFVLMPAILLIFPGHAFAELYKKSLVRKLLLKNL